MKRWLVVLAAILVACILIQPAAAQDLSVTLCIGTDGFCLRCAEQAVSGRATVTRSRHLRRRARPARAFSTVRAILRIQSA
jgi:hypothetical protein